ncbi:MAG TPA: pitrilysin family protein [Pyrinomonadaceae bacterium]|nr:pitrilysin family protein [Pyrinomonadaceae bacterium]
MQSEQIVEGVEFVAEGEGIREYRLRANGLKILLVENRVAPVVTFCVLYRVGSRNEAVGHTGSTHLLEHMLFKGTPTFNKEAGTQIAATLQRIGADFNATTWYDRTNYFETVPSDQLDLAVRLEADRMRNSFIADADRQSEMTVVRNELERGQNEPMLVLDEAVYATAFREHPYHHPTIGWRSDVENVPTARLKEFYDTFYYPDNATAILVGDFDERGALALVVEHFGGVPRSAAPIPEVYTEEPPQEGERRLVVRRAGELALIQIAFRTPAVLGQTTVLSNSALAERAAAPPAENDIYALVVLSAALSNGVTSRLYQALVETELAVSAATNCDQFRDPGLFNVYVTVRPGVEPREVERVTLAELARVGAEGLTEAEAGRAKRQILAEVAYNRDGTLNVASQISEAEAVADWRFYRDYAANISRVGAADVRRVAAKYFVEENRTVGHFIPKSDGDAHDSTGGSGTPASAALVNPPRLVPRRLQRHHDPRDPDARNSFASRVARAELDTGAVLLVLENRATPTVSLRASLRAGSFFEPRDRPGLARITADMLERGTQRRTKLQLAGDLEGVGAQLEFSTDPFAVNVSGRALAQDVRLLIEALAEQLREPSFPADELEKLKQQTVAAIQEQQSNTRHRAYERFTQVVYDPANPFHLPAGEQLVASIRSITVEDVRRFYAARYGGRSLVLSIAGDVRAAEVGEIFRESFATFAGPESVAVEVADPTPQEGARREVVLVKEKANVDVLIGSAAPLRRDAGDYYAALIANSALGESTLSSRLGLQVRDKEGLTYGIGSRFRAPSLAAGPWYIAVSVNPQNVERAIESALNVLREYVERGIREDELADEKSSAVGAFKVALSTNAGLAEALWNAEFYGLGPDYVDRFPRLISEVTADEVNAAIRKYFRPDHLTVVLAGDTGQEAPAAAPLA